MRSRSTPRRRALCGTISEFRKVRFTVSAQEIPCSSKKLPCSSKKIPCSVAQGILLQAYEFARVLAFKIGIGLANSMEFPVIFPVRQGISSRDEFESICVRRQDLVRKCSRAFKLDDGCCADWSFTMCKACQLVEQESRAPRAAASRSPSSRTASTALVEGEDGRRSGGVALR